MTELEQRIKDLGSRAVLSGAKTYIFATEDELVELKEQLKNCVLEPVDLEDVTL